MRRPEVPVTQITVADAGQPGEPEAGRRQRKKQRTREALIEAAMGLFERRGFHHTSVREITDAVDVSERTFFRYFASKEDLVLSFVRDGTATFTEALAARPPQEDPLTAARQAFHMSLRQVSESTVDPPSYLSAMRLIDSTPSLLAAYLSAVHERDGEIIEVLARREGVDPATDRRPRVLTAVIASLAFLANEDWQQTEDGCPEAMADAFDAYVDAVVPALAGHWAGGRKLPG
jgi:AcrR family transcriptional regulator